MEVIKSKRISDSHSIEWGYATWTQNEEEKDYSIRNRFDKADGGFNVSASSEIPLCDFNEMIVQSIKEKQFTKKELRLICKKSFLELLRSLF
jgi:hypothetical protein